jgi:hypothetical protein
MAAIAAPAIAVDRKKKATLGSPDAASLAVRKESAASNLKSFYTATGPYRLSVDAVGTVLSFGTVEVDKPAGGVMRRAFLVAASGGYGGGEIRDGDVQIEGRRILWDRSIPNVIGGWNVLADVTDLIKTKIDETPEGRVIIEIAEENSEFIDGALLAVVFEIAGEKEENDDISLFFGAHGPSGNGFTVELSEPVSANVVDTRYKLGVGITFGLQTSTETRQYTVIDVNTRRLTAAAGGPDDGSPLAGALITVGGVDDNPANPPDAVAMPTNLASDDEYYDLTPFVKPGDTRIEVETANPSKDDNFFFASFVARRGITPQRVATGTAFGITGGVALPNQPVDQVTLAASTTRGAVGSESEITASVLGGGVPLANVDVRLQIVSGPHAGATSKARTNASGRATFLYRGIAAGTDLIVAVVDNSGSAVAGSNVMLYEWVEELRAFIDVEPGTCPNTFNPRMQDMITVALVGTPHFDVDEVDEASLYMDNAAPMRVQYQDISRPGEGDDCPCSDEGRDGYQDLVLWFRIEDLFVDPAGLAANESRQLTLSGKFKSGSAFEATNCIVVSSAASTTTLPDNILVPTEEGFPTDR